MKKFKFIAFFSLILFIFPLLTAKAETLANRLSGRILLAVEDKGQAWYIEPGAGTRAFLGRPADAFRIMRELGLGISENDYNKWNGTAPERLRGRILLRVEANGEAYYVNPLDLKLNYLGRPSDAFNVMRELGLGITDKSLATITVHESYPEAVAAAEDTGKAVEEEAPAETADETTTTTDEEAVDETEEAATTTEEAIPDEIATSTEETATTTDEIAETTASTCEFQADYYKATNLTGRLLTRTETGINNNWGEDSPEGINRTDKFSVRWSGNCYFSEGRYRFFGTYNDALRATLDSSVWINKVWSNTNTDRDFSTELDVSEGMHYLKVEYYENYGDASVVFDWEKVDV